MFLHGIHPSILLALGHGLSGSGVTSFDVLRADNTDNNTPAGGGGGGGDDDDDNDDEDAKFSQADVDRIVKRRLKKAESENKKVLAEFESLKKRIEDAEKEAADAADDIDDDTDDGGAKANAGLAKELAKLKREAARNAEAMKVLETERDEARVAAETSHKNLNSHVIQQRASAALIAAGVLPSALQHATADFVRDSELETDDDGTHRVILRYGGVPYEDAGDGEALKKGAAKYLATNTFYAQAPSGGGHRRPSGGANGGGSFDIDKTSGEDLITAGLRD